MCCFSYRPASWKMLDLSLDLYPMSKVKAPATLLRNKREDHQQNIRSWSGQSQGAFRSSDSSTAAAHIRQARPLNCQGMHPWEELCSGHWHRPAVPLQSTREAAALSTPSPGRCGQTEKEVHGEEKGELSWRKPLLRTCKLYSCNDFQRGDLFQCARRVKINSSGQQSESVTDVGPRTSLSSRKE